MLNTEKICEGKMGHMNCFTFVKVGEEEAAIKVGRMKAAKILMNSLRPSVG